MSITSPHSVASITSLDSGGISCIADQDNVIRPKRTIFRRCAALLKDASGVALIEFAVSLPLLLLFATAGLELANYVLTLKRVGEMAAMVADNASRMGAQNIINDKPISEAEINDVFTGAEMQSGGLNVAQNGRIILSSLQKNEDGGQTIKWQRCYGAGEFASSWGVEGDGATGSDFDGMGPQGSLVTASDGTAVMVVEVHYHYKPIMPVMFMPLGDLHESASFNVRDTRDLSGVHNDENVTVSHCTTTSPENNSDSGNTSAPAT
ncbi:MAG: pilus assembly protein [Sphingobium sp.]|nr:pilus assembly protein [Sphingobium sp.]